MIRFADLRNASTSSIQYRLESDGSVTAHVRSVLLFPHNKGIRSLLDFGGARATAAFGDLPSSVHVKEIGLVDERFGQRLLLPIERRYDSDMFGILIEMRLPSDVSPNSPGGWQ